jgi:hypothetical protein
LLDPHRGTGKTPKTPHNWPEDEILVQKQQERIKDKKEKDEL